MPPINASAGHVVPIALCVDLEYTASLHRLIYVHIIKTCPTQNPLNCIQLLCAALSSKTLHLENHLHMHHFSAQLFDYTGSLPGQASVKTFT